MIVDIFLTTGAKIENIKIRKLSNGITNIYFDDKNYTNFQYDDYRKINNLVEVGDCFHGFVKNKKQWLECVLEIKDK